MNLPRFVGVKQTKAEPDGIRIKAVIKAVSPPAWLLVGVWQRGGEKENNRMSASLLVPPHSNPGRRRGNAEDGKLAGDQQRKTEQGETCKRRMTKSDGEHAAGKAPTSPPPARSYSTADVCIGWSMGGKCWRLCAQAKVKVQQLDGKAECSQYASWSSRLKRKEPCCHTRCLSENCQKNMLRLYKKVPTGEPHHFERLKENKSNTY